MQALLKKQKHDTKVSIGQIFVEDATLFKYDLYLSQKAPQQA